MFAGGVYLSVLHRDLILASTVNQASAQTAAPGWSDTCSNMPQDITVCIMSQKDNLKQTCPVVLQRALPAPVRRQLRIVGEGANPQGCPIVGPVRYAGHERQNRLDCSLGQVLNAKIPGRLRKQLQQLPHLLRSLDPLSAAQCCNRGQGGQEAHEKELY